MIVDEGVEEFEPHGWWIECNSNKQNYNSEKTTTTTTTNSPYIDYDWHNLACYHRLWWEEAGRGMGAGLKRNSV